MKTDQLNDGLRTLSIYMKTVLEYGARTIYIIRTQLGSHTFICWTTKFMLDQMHFRCVKGSRFALHCYVCLPNGPEFGNDFDCEQ